MGIPGRGFARRMRPPETRPYAVRVESSLARRGRPAQGRPRRAGTSRDDSASRNRARNEQRKDSRKAPQRHRDAPASCRGRPALAAADTPFHFEVEESRDDSFVSPFLGDSPRGARNPGHVRFASSRARRREPHRAPAPPVVKPSPKSKKLVRLTTRPIRPRPPVHTKDRGTGARAQICTARARACTRRRRSCARA